jgi:hypothetical protein
VVGGSTAMSMIVKSFRWMAPGRSSGSCTRVGGGRSCRVWVLRCAGCWVAGRGLFDDGARSTPRAADGGRSADIASALIAGVHRPPSWRRHRRWSTGPPGAARRLRLAVMAGSAGPAHDPCCDVGGDARVRRCVLDLDRLLGGSAASGGRPGGRSGHRRCRCRDGGRCTPTTRRDVGRSIAVPGNGWDNMAVFNWGGVFNSAVAWTS